MVGRGFTIAPKDQGHLPALLKLQDHEAAVPQQALCSAALLCSAQSGARENVSEAGQEGQNQSRKGEVRGVHVFLTTLGPEPC